jgi:hypothetical protein
MPNFPNSMKVHIQGASCRFVLILVLIQGNATFTMQLWTRHVFFFFPSKQKTTSHENFEYHSGKEEIDKQSSCMRAWCRETLEVLKNSDLPASLILNE